MSTSVTTVSGYTIPQAARVLRCSCSEIYAWLDQGQVQGTSNERTGAITIFLPESLSVKPGSTPSAPKSREKRDEDMTDHKPPTKKQSAWLADMGSPVPVLPR